MKFIKAQSLENKTIYINIANITYITDKVGISGSVWTAKLKSEIRFNGSRDVGYSELKPTELKTIDLLK